MITMGQAGLAAVARMMWPERATSSCRNKLTHPTQGKADAQMRSLIKRSLCDTARIHTYYCRVHRGWHVGHQSPHFLAGTA